MTKKVYIAGPMSGLPDFNSDAFFEAAMRLARKGNVPLHTAWMLDDFDYSDYMAVSLALLNAADSIYMLQGWESSKGATFEHATALMRGMVVEFEE